MRAEWQRPGKATGRLRCLIDLPAIDLRQDLRHGRFDAIRRFVRRYLPVATEAQEDGSFVISAEIRAPKRGVRWRPIVRWRAGESVEAALDRAAARLRDLPRERQP